LIAVNSVFFWPPPLIRFILPFRSFSLLPISDVDRGVLWFSIDDSFKLFGVFSTTFLWFRISSEDNSEQSWTKFVESPFVPISNNEGFCWQSFGESFLIGDDAETAVISGLFGSVYTELFSNGEMLRASTELWK
jgi:hypothetical protein